jgi:hypothetical protein
MQDRQAPGKVLCYSKPPLLTCGLFSHRYLRLSKNNIRTLLKLCKDAGLDVDIHPHMVEAEIDSQKVFARQQRIAL